MRFVSIFSTDSFKVHSGKLWKVHIFGLGQHTKCIGHLEQLRYFSTLVNVSAIKSHVWSFLFPDQSCTFDWPFRRRRTRSGSSQGQSCGSPTSKREALSHLPSTSSPPPSPSTTSAGNTVLGSTQGNFSFEIWQFYKTFVNYWWTLPILRWIKENPLVPTQ